MSRGEKGRETRPSRRPLVFKATQDPKTNEIAVEWHLINGVSGAFQDAADLYRCANDKLSSTDSEGKLILSAMEGLFRLAGSAKLPPIDGEMRLVLTSNGRWEMVYKMRDPYPSLEVYRYSTTGIQTIDQKYEQYGPDYGLSDAAPRDAFYSSWYFTP